MNEINGQKCWNLMFQNEFDVGCVIACWLPKLVLSEKSLCKCVCVSVHLSLRGVPDLSPYDRRDRLQPPLPRSPAPRKSLIVRLTIGASLVPAHWFTLPPHSRKIPGSNPCCGLSVWSFHALPVPVPAWSSSGYSSFLPV